MLRLESVSHNGRCIATPMLYHSATAAAKSGHMTTRMMTVSSRLSDDHQKVLWADEGGLIMDG